MFVNDSDDEQATTLYKPVLQNIARSASQRVIRSPTNSPETALGVTKRVIVDRGCSFSPLFSLNNWLTVLHKVFIAPLDDLLCIVRLFTSYAHASVLTRRLTLDLRFAQPGDPVTPDDTLVVYRIRTSRRSFRDALPCVFANNSSTTAFIIAHLTFLCASHMITKGPKMSLFVLQALGMKPHLPHRSIRPIVVLE